jgi:hypothetical protein
MIYKTVFYCILFMFINNIILLYIDWHLIIIIYELLVARSPSILSLIHHQR